MDIIWHREFATAWLERIRSGRRPHAVMLLGPPGVGKRAAASWLAAQHLAIEPRQALPQYPWQQVQHADMRWIEPLDGRQTIGIEQIRDLVADVALTSYEGRGKAGVISPANLMTTNAANSLLKTLEEPPGDTLLVLVADRVGGLPATILSRCQRIEMQPPAAADGLAWLDRIQPGVAWGEALGLAGNAPLAAIDARERLDTHAGMSRDFAAVAAGRRSASTVARNWGEEESGFVLDWLARQVQELITISAGGPPGAFGRGFDKSVLARMDRKNLFCYLDTINRLRARPAGSFNAQLAIESLLIDLADGLERCREGLPADGMRHMLTEMRAHE